MQVDSEARKASYDTNSDTKPPCDSRERLQVVEELVELVGIEPTTSSLRTMRVAALM
jgi:hypothetical protein